MIIAEVVILSIEKCSHQKVLKILYYYIVHEKL